MRYLLFTDFHLRKDRLWEQKIVLKEIIEICLKKKIKSIIFLGDMFDNRSNITPYELLLFQWFLYQCYKNGISFNGIAGNHDKPTNESEKSYLGVFANENKNIYIFEDKNLQAMGKFLFIPYFPERILIDLIKNFKEKNNIEYVFMHACFNGAMTNSGKIMNSKLVLEHFKNYKKLMETK